MEPYVLGFVVIAALALGGLLAWRMPSVGAAVASPAAEGSRSRRPSRSRVVAVGLWLAAGAVFVLLGRFGLFGLSADSPVGALLRADPERVRAIVLSPVCPSGAAAVPTCRNLVSGPIRVEDRSTIRLVLLALTEATPWARSTHMDLWEVALVLELDDGRVGARVVQTDGEGTILSIQTEGVARWNLGSYRSDGLRRLLEALAGAVADRPFPAQSSPSGTRP